MVNVPVFVAYKEDYPYDAFNIIIMGNIMAKGRIQEQPPVAVETPTPLGQLQAAGFSTKQIYTVFKVEGGAQAIDAITRMIGAAQVQPGNAAAPSSQSSSTSVAFQVPSHAPALSDLEQLASQMMSQNEAERDYKRKRRGADPRSR